MDNFKRYRFPGLVLVILVGLAVIFRSFIMADIIEPIALLFWAVWRIILSVDQNVYWVILIAVCLMLMMRIFPLQEKQNPNPAYRYKHSDPNRVEYWQTLMTDSTLGQEQTEYLRDNFKKLFLAVVSQQEHLDSAVLDEKLFAEQLHLPAEARRFLYPPKEKKGVLAPGWRLKFGPVWFNRWLGKFDQQDMNSMTEILEWMETEMELRKDE